MKLNRKEPFATIVEADPVKKKKDPTRFVQNGIRYDGQGNPVDEQEVQDYRNKVAADAQARADAAMEAARKEQAAADAEVAAIDAQIGAAAEPEPEPEAPPPPPKKKAAAKKAAAK